MPPANGDYPPPPPKVSRARWIACHILLDRGVSGREIMARLGISLAFILRVRRARAPYLREPCFREPDCGVTIKERDRPIVMPSPDQIRRRCEAIRKHFPRLPVGQAGEPWEAPVVPELVLRPGVDGKEAS